MRGLVTDLTSLRRGADLSLKTGFTGSAVVQERFADADIAGSRILHTGPAMP